jgi:hypothetical protein
MLNTKVATKADAGKLRWSRLPWEVLELVVKLLEAGATNYPDREDGEPNWKHVPDGEQRYLEALTRHLAEIHKGSPIDSESGFSHLTHIAANALFCLWFQVKKDRG